MKPQLVQAKQTGRCFSVEVSEPVEWILDFEHFLAGKLNNGSLVVVDRYEGDDGTGWVLRTHKKLAADLADGCDYEALWRALAHALGIEKFRWKGIWLDTDDYLCDYPEGPEALKAYQKRRAGQLEAAGRTKAAAAFRQQVGLAPA